MSVALPSDVTGELEVTVNVSGTVYEPVDIPGLMKYKIRDRWFDAEACDGGLALYVDNLEVLDRLEK